MPIISPFLPKGNSIHPLPFLPPPPSYGLISQPTITHIAKEISHAPLNLPLQNDKGVWLTYMHWPINTSIPKLGPLLPPFCRPRCILHLKHIIPFSDWMRFWLTCVVKLRAANQWLLAATSSYPGQAVTVWRLYAKCESVTQCVYFRLWVRYGLSVCTALQYKARLVWADMVKFHTNSLEKKGQCWFTLNVSQFDDAMASGLS